MQVAMETEADMVVKRLSVPIGLEELMESLTKEVLRRKPSDIYAFASEHFAQLLEIRDQGNIKGSLKKNRQNYLQSSRDTAESKEGKNNPIKVKAATFGAMTRTTNKTTMRNKSPAPKSFISKKYATVSKVSPRTQNSNNKEDRNKLILEKRKVSKKNMEDARKKLESQGQPIELESKRIGDVPKRFDVSKRRQSIVQKKNEEKESVEKARSRSTSKSKKEDASKSTTERYRRKSDVSKGIKKGSEIAKLTSNAEVGELKTQKVITPEKISPRNKEGKRRMSRDGKRSRITPSNIETSDEVVTQMGRHSLKGKDQVHTILDTSKCEQLDAGKDRGILDTVPTQGEQQIPKVEEISATEIKETGPDQISAQLTTNQELCNDGLNISFEDSEKITVEEIDLIIKNTDSENAAVRQSTYIGSNEKSNFDKDSFQPDRDKTDEIIESNVKDPEYQDLTPGAENGKQSDNNDKKTLDAIKAAVKIQSLVRGYIVRKSISKKTISFRDQDKFQGDINIPPQVRKLDKKILAIEDAIVAESKIFDDYLSKTDNAEKEADEREKAAVKIQSMVRGHLCRKNLNVEKDIKDEEGTLSDTGISKKDVTKEEAKTNNVDLERIANDDTPSFVYVNDIEDHFISHVKEIVKVQALVRGYLLRRSLLKNATPHIEIYALEKEEVNKISKPDVKDENLSANELDLESEILKEITDVASNQESKIELDKEKLTEVLENNHKIDTSSLTNEIDAITKIQALIRGYLSRKSRPSHKNQETINSKTEHLVQIRPTDKKDVLNDDDSGTYPKLDNAFKEATASFIGQEQIHYDSNRYDHSLGAINYASLDEVGGIKRNYEEESERNPKKESKDTLIKFDTNDAFGDNIKPRANSIEKIADAPNYVNDAATKIQSAWRCHRIRRSVKPMKLGNLQAPLECDELPHQRGISEDAKKAAIIIQALFRGYMTRKRCENAEHLSLKRRGFEGSLPTLLEVEGEDNKRSTSSSDHERIDESSDVLSNTESHHTTEGDTSLREADTLISEKSRTISDEEVFTALKQLDDAPVPTEEPRRKSKSYRRSLTFDDPSIHQGNNLLTKSTTFVIGDEFQKFDTSDSAFPSLRSTETDEESLCTESESKLMDETNDISEITISIKEDVQKLKKTLENGVEAEKMFEDEHNDGNITEITKSISKQVKELEKALNQDSVNNSILSSRDFIQNTVESVSESTEFSTRPVSKDSVTSTDSVDTVIFNDIHKRELLCDNEMKEGTLHKIPLGRSSTKSDFDSSSSGEYNDAVHLNAVKEQGDILVNDILDTAKLKLQDKDTEKQFFEQEPVLQLTTDKRQSTTSDELRQLWQDEAATTIQKNYRGYRVRRDLGKQQKAAEGTMEKEKCVDQEITRYLNQITEPIRRAFSADKSFSSTPGKNFEIEERVHSASEVIPDIIYIPLRDYSSEEQGIQETVSTPTANIQNLETNNNEEIVKDEEIMKRKEHQALLLNPHETDDTNELLNVLVDEVDKSVDDKISACISSIVEPLTKHFQPIGSIDEKEEAEVNVEEPGPVYQYIPLRNYSEDENKENESLPVLNDNITTTMSILKEQLEENEGEELSANEEFAKIHDSDQSISDTIVNEKSPDNFLYEHFTPEEVVREGKVAGGNMFTATTKQVSIHPTVEYGSKEINEYISSIIEPAKTSPVLSKRKSPPIPEQEESYKTIALRDYKDVGSNEEERMQIKNEREDIETVIKGEIISEDEVIGGVSGKEKEDNVNENEASVNQELKEENASNITHASIGDEIKQELQSINSVVLDSSVSKSMQRDAQNLKDDVELQDTVKHLENITESEIPTSKKVIDGVPGFLGGESEISQEKLLQTANLELHSGNESMIDESTEVFSQAKPKKADIDSEFRKTANIVKNIQNLKEITERENSELINKLSESIDEVKESILANKELENSDETPDNFLAKEKVSKSVEENETLATDTNLEVCKVEQVGLLEEDEADLISNQGESAKGDHIEHTMVSIEHTGETGENKFDVKIVEDKTIDNTIDTSDQIGDIITEISNIRIGSNDDSQADETRDTEENIKAADTLNGNESEITLSIGSGMSHEERIQDLTEADQHRTDDNLNFELSNSLSDSTDNSLDIIRVEIKDKLHGAEVLYNIQEDNIISKEVRDVENGKENYEKSQVSTFAEHSSLENDAKEHNLPTPSINIGSTEKSQANNEQVMNDLQREIITQASVVGNTETDSKHIEISGSGNVEDKQSDRAEITQNIDGNEVPQKSNDTIKNDNIGLEVKIPNYSADWRLPTNEEIDREESKPMTVLSPSENQFEQGMDSIEDQELQNKMEIIESEIEDVLGKISSAALDKRYPSSDESGNTETAEIVGGKSLDSDADLNVLSEEDVTGNEKDILSKAHDVDEWSGSKLIQDTESCIININSAGEKMNENKPHIEVSSETSTSSNKNIETPSTMMNDIESNGLNTCQSLNNEVSTEVNGVLNTDTKPPDYSHTNELKVEENICNESHVEVVDENISIPDDTVHKNVNSSLAKQNIAKGITDEIGHDIHDKDATLEPDNIRKMTEDVYPEQQTKVTNDGLKKDQLVPNLLYSEDIEQDENKSLAAAQDLDSVEDISNEKENVGEGSLNADNDTTQTRKGIETNTDPDKNIDISEENSTQASTTADISENNIDLGANLEAMIVIPDVSTMRETKEAITNTEDELSSLEVIVNVGKDETCTLKTVVQDNAKLDADLEDLHSEIERNGQMKQNNIEDMSTNKPIADFPIAHKNEGKIMITDAAKEIGPSTVIESTNEIEEVKKDTSQSKLEQVNNIGNPNEALIINDTSIGLVHERNTKEGPHLHLEKTDSCASSDISKSSKDESSKLNDLQDNIKLNKCTEDFHFKDNKVIDASESIKQADTEQPNKDAEHDTLTTTDVKQIDTEQLNEVMEYNTQESDAPQNINKADIEQSNKDVDYTTEKTVTLENIKQTDTNQSNQSVEHDTQPIEINETIKQADAEELNKVVQYDDQAADATENIKRADTEHSNKFIEHDFQATDETENLKHANIEQLNKGVEHDIQPTDAIENIKQTTTEQSNKDVKYENQLSDVTEYIKQADTEQSNKDVEHDTQPTDVIENIKQTDSDQLNKDVEHDAQPTDATENTKQVDTEQSNKNVEHDTQPIDVIENTKQTDSDKLNKDVEHDTHPTDVTENIKQTVTEQSNKDVEHNFGPIDIPTNIKHADTEQSNKNVEHDTQPTNVAESRTQASAEQSNTDVEHDTQPTNVTESITQASTEQLSKDVQHDTRPTEVTDVIGNTTQASTEQSNKNVKHNFGPTDIAANIKHTDIEQSNKDVEHDIQPSNVTESITQASTEQSNKDVEHLTGPTNVTESITQASTEQSNEDVECNSESTDVAENINLASIEHSNKDVEHEIQIIDATEDIKQAATEQLNKDVQHDTQSTEVTDVIENTTQASTEQSSKGVANYTQPIDITENIKQADTKKSNKEVEHDTQPTNVTESLTQASTEQSNKDVQYNSESTDVAENIKLASTEHSNKDMEHEIQPTDATEDIKQAATEQLKKDVQHDTQPNEVTENIKLVNVEQSNEDVEHDTQPVGVTENEKQANGSLEHDYQLTDTTENIKQAATEQSNNDVEHTQPANVTENVKQGDTGESINFVQFDTQPIDEIANIKQTNPEQVTVCEIADDSFSQQQHSEQTVIDLPKADMYVQENHVLQECVPQTIFTTGIKPDLNKDKNENKQDSNVSQNENLQEVEKVSTISSAVEVPTFQNAAEGIKDSESCVINDIDNSVIQDTTKLNIGSDTDNDQIAENKGTEDVDPSVQLTKIEDNELHESTSNNEPIPIVGNSRGESEDAESFSGFTDELQKYENYNTRSDIKHEDKNQDHVINNDSGTLEVLDANPALIENELEENLLSKQEKIGGSEMTCTKNEVYEERPEEVITQRDELEEVGGTQQTSPFYLHQDSFIQDSPSAAQEKKFSEALRVNADSTKENDSVAATEKLLHSSELHDSIPINVATETPQKPLPTQTNGVQCNIGRERSASTSTVLVHSGELHDNILPLALQMNQDPGIEIVTSSNKHQTSVVDAQASNKDVSARLGRLDRARAQSESGGNPSSMDTEKRNNSTLVKKNMESEAATKIQASFRGYQVRKQLKNKLARDNITSIKRTTRRRSLGRIMEAKSANKQPSDLEEQSATKIQAGVRGFLVRRRQKKTKTSVE